MQHENVKEYELVRNEMITVKECITKYVGFVLGGAGAAVFLISRIGQSSTPSIPMSSFESAIVCFAISTIINFVLLILYYKFYSHNRFAGYCKLLNHERYCYKEKNENNKDNEDTDEHKVEGSSMLSWEVSVDTLRYLDTHENLPEEIRKLENLPEEIRKFKIIENDITIVRLNQIIDNIRAIPREIFGKGFGILINAILGKTIFRSWAFPPLIVAMFFIISWGFFITGCIFFNKVITDRINTETIWYMVILFLLFIIIQMRLWYQFIGKLYMLMEGSATVEAFFWRFIPIRASLLNSQDISPKYIESNPALSSYRNPWPIEYSYALNCEGAVFFSGSG